MKVLPKVSIPQNTPFISNKYTQAYYSIITSASQRPQIKVKDQYTERHHIIPDSFYINNRSKGKSPGWLEGNSNDKSNMVRLSPREHFICHWLLTKMVMSQAVYKMQKALVALRRSGSNHKRVYSSAHYAHLRKLSAKILSEQNKNRVQSDQERAKRSAALKGRKRPEHVIQALQQANLNRVVSEDTKQKLSKIFKGSKRGDDTRAKISAAQVGRSLSAATRQNIMIGRCKSFLKKFYQTYDILNRETFEDAKAKGVIPQRTCLSLDSIITYLGRIPLKGEFQ
jgi:hypothetical protein